MIFLAAIQDKRLKFLVKIPLINILYYFFVGLFVSNCLAIYERIIRPCFPAGGSVPAHKDANPVGGF